jgi:hypothetical protein
MSIQVPGGGAIPPNFDPETADNAEDVSQVKPSSSLLWELTPTWGIQKVERQFAVTCIKHCEAYYKLVTSIRPSTLKLTPSVVLALYRRLFVWCTHIALPQIRRGTVFVVQGGIPLVL